MRERDVYGREHVAVVTADEAAALDRDARTRHGVPERVLMENAGRSAAQLVERLFPRGRVVAAVGSGHNGGDALVLLRTLRAWGRDVAFIPTGSREPDPTLTHGHSVPEFPFDNLTAALTAADVLVDGILGTGASGAPRDRAAQAIRALGASGRPVVALDLPSGVDATTGAVPGDAVSAAVTVTFGWPKLGLLLHPARQRCGRLVAVEIGFPPMEAGPDASRIVLTPAWAAARLPRRTATAHKGTAGRVLVISGRHGMAGAAAVTAHAALRAGAGYLRLASHESNREILQTLVPEAVYVDRGDRDALEAAAQASDAIVVGPGIGTDTEADDLLESVLNAAPGRSMVLDADALTLVAARAGRLAAIAAERPVVVTPHPGEMRRLTGSGIDAIVSAPVEAAVDLARSAGCVVLLKGAPSVVASPDARVRIDTQHSSDLATAGMGDQLSGTIGAFLAAGAAPADAAGLGLFYSGRAATLAARGRSLGPRDVSEMLGEAFDDPGPSDPPIALPFVTFDQPPSW